jgi:hypothetical protein
MYYDL